MGVHTFLLKGREDGIIKVGGKRVDLAEVESRIKALSGIKDVFVFSLPTGSSRENEIVALFVCEAGVTEKDLRRRLMEILEPYSMPRRMKVVASIPTTPMGKRDLQTALDLLGDSGE